MSDAGRLLKCLADPRLVTGNGSFVDDLRRGASKGASMPLAVILWPMIERAEPGGQVRFAVCLGDQVQVMPEESPEHWPIVYQEVFEAHRVVGIPSLGGGR